MQAAEALASDGIAAEVIDLRVLRPLDDAAVMASVRKCRRAVIVDEGWRSGSLPAELAARIVEQAFFDLDAPLARVHPDSYSTRLGHRAGTTDGPVIGLALDGMGVAWLRRACSSFVEGAPQTDLSAQFPR